MEAQSNIVIENLLNKFIAGKSTLDDKHQLFNFLSSSENDSFFKEILFKQLAEYNEEQTEKAIDIDGIYDEILYEIKQLNIDEIENFRLPGKSRIRKLLIYGSSIAAVFIIAFLLGNIFQVSNKTISEPVVTFNYNEIKAPFGSRSEIKLPDGTQVILNAGSTLKYRSDFSLSNRELGLTGEAYFKVAKDKHLPLIVSAGNISIKAIGTEFNVKAYDEEGTIETTLVEGKVEIIQFVQNKEGNRYLDLNPNQKAIYIKESDSIALEKIQSTDLLVSKPVKIPDNNILISPKIDVTQVVAWTQGKLIIRGESLDNLCIELQRKYDVKFIFMEEKIKKYRFSGVLLDETLEQVLNVIKLTSPINYSLEGKTVFLSPNKEQLNNYSKHLKE